MDVGGVVEFYPSRRVVTRFDVGDTIIRYGIYREPVGVVCTSVCPPPDVFERPAETRHNLQFSAGLYHILRDPLRAPTNYFTKVEIRLSFT